MFSHITVGTNNIAESEKFYNAVLEPLGFRQRWVEPDGGPRALCWIAGDNPLPRFYVYEPFDAKPAYAGNGVMVAFEATSPDMVDIAFDGGIKFGGRNEGGPGPRQRYGDGYYGAYLRDPAGNKLHVVYRGDVT